MSGSAIMMMVIGIVVIWGGLALSIANLFKKKHKLKNICTEMVQMFFMKNCIRKKLNNHTTTTRKSEEVNGNWNKQFILKCVID